MIFVDARENPSGIPDMLKKIGLPILVRNIPVGDYVIQSADSANSVAVERKEISDYFSSKQSGRLDNQLYSLSTNFSLSFLVIIGNIQNYMIQNRIPPQTFYGSYIGSQIKISPDGKRGTVIVNDVPTDEDFVLYLKTLHDKFQEGNFTRLPKFVTSTSSSEDVAIANLCTLPNVGPIKAKEILKKHITLGEAYMAFMVSGNWDVKGIGEETKKKISEVLNHRHGERE